VLEIATFPGNVALQMRPGRQSRDLIPDKVRGAVPDRAVTDKFHSLNRHMSVPLYAVFPYLITVQQYRTGVSLAYTLLLITCRDTTIRPYVPSPIRIRKDYCREINVHRLGR